MMYVFFLCRTARSIFENKQYRAFVQIRINHVRSQRARFIRMILYKF